MAYTVPPNSPAPEHVVVVPSGTKRRKPMEEAAAFSAALSAKLKVADRVYNSLIDYTRTDLDEDKAKEHVTCYVTAYKKGLVMENEVVQMRIKEKLDADAKRVRIANYASSVPLSHNRRNNNTQILLQQTERNSSNEKDQNGENNNKNTMMDALESAAAGVQTTPPTSAAAPETTTTPTITTTTTNITRATPSGVESR